MGASENQIEKHVCREFGVAYADLVALDIVREHARNPLYGRDPALLMGKALKFGKSLGLHRDDSAHRKRAGAPTYRDHVPADLGQSSLAIRRITGSNVISMGAGPSLKAGCHAMTPWV